MFCQALKKIEADTTMSKMIDRLLNKITTHPDEKRNLQRLSLSMMIQSADMPLFGGTALQAFQVKIGLSTSQMGMFGALSQVAGLASYFLCMGLADRIRNRVLAYAMSIAMMAVFPILLVLLSAGPAWMRRPHFALPVMITGSMLQTALVAFMALMASVVFVRAISPHIQGKSVSIIGAGGGLLGLATGAVSTVALARLGYPNGFTVSFALGVGLLLLAAFFTRNIKEIPELCVGATPTPIWPFQAVKTVVGTKEFKLLVWPNVLRGLCCGAGGYAMVIGMNRFDLGVEYAGYTTLLASLGNIIGTAGIGFTVDRHGAGRVLLWSNLCMAMSLVGLALAPSLWMFLFAFFTMSVSLACEGTTVPLAHFAIVPQPILGAFSAVRLILFIGTIAISSMAIGYLLDQYSAAFVLGGSAVLSVVTGFVWLCAFNKGHKTPPVEALAADASAFITGTNIPVDGDYTAK